MFTISKILNSLNQIFTLTQTPSTDWQVSRSSKKLELMKTVGNKVSTTGVACDRGSVFNFTSGWQKCACERLNMWTSGTCERLNMWTGCWSVTERSVSRFKRRSATKLCFLSHQTKCKAPTPSKVLHILPLSVGVFNWTSESFTSLLKFKDARKTLCW